MTTVDDEPGYLRLRAAVDERDQRLQRASQGFWTYTPSSGWRVNDEETWAYVELNTDNDDPAAPVCLALTGPLMDEQSRHDAEYIAYEGPQAVHRHVLRDLQVLTKHYPVRDTSRGVGIWCARCWEQSRWPCLDVEIMAAAYQVKMEPFHGYSRT